MGPSSFALDNSGALVLQQPSQSASGPQISLTGGGGVRADQGQASQAPGGQFALAASQDEQLNSKMLDAVNKLTQGALQPLIEQQQKAAYFQGMSQVAQGRSLIDIENQQPWYSKIFGPSSTVQGAQAMTALTAVTQAQTQFLQDMPQLREQSPDQVRQYLVQQATQIGNTGDPYTDAMVQAKLAEQWGPMLKTHMENYVQWRQEDSAKKWTNMGMSQGNLLQSYLHSQNGPVDPIDAAQEVQKFTDTLARPPGMTDDSYGKLLSSQAQGQLAAGNFEAYTAMKHNSDIWNSIPLLPTAHSGLQGKLRHGQVPDGAQSPQCFHEGVQLRCAEYPATPWRGAGLTDELTGVVDSHAPFTACMVDNTRDEGYVPYEGAALDGLEPPVPVVRDDLWGQVLHAVARDAVALQCPQLDVLCRGSALEWSNGETVSL